MTSRAVDTELVGEMGGGATHPAVTEIATAARDIFGSNLRLSFVGGSYARGLARPDSDVDILVITDRPNLETEHVFAQAFQQTHERHGLKFEHYGEVFDIVTAMRLISYATAVLSVTDRIQHTACYHGDCILSVFRKGDVFLKFFADEKVAVQGDRALLGTLESEAHTYFQRFSKPRIQLEKKRLVVPEDVAAYEEYQNWSSWIAEAGRSNSPVGVGLERWFAVSLIGLDQAVIATDEQQPSGPRNICPLAWTKRNERLGRIVRHQCLGADKSSAKPDD